MDLQVVVGAYGVFIAPGYADMGRFTSVNFRLFYVSISLEILISVKVYTEDSRYLELSKAFLKKNCLR